MHETSKTIWRGFWALLGGSIGQNQAQAATVLGRKGEEPLTFALEKKNGERAPIARVLGGRLVV